MSEHVKKKNKTTPEYNEKKKQYWNIIKKMKKTLHLLTPLIPTSLATQARVNLGTGIALTVVT